MNRITLSEMAKRLEKSPKTLRRYVNEWAIPHFKLGKTLYFDPKEVEAFLAARVLAEANEPTQISNVRKKRTAARAQTNRFAKALGVI